MNKIYELFSICFPMLSLTCELFTELSGADEAKSFCEYDGDKLIAAALVRKDIIVMMCVHPDYRCKGTGDMLLRKCEDYIKEQGYTRANIGSTSSELFIGAPEEYGAFFEKRGYVLSEPYAEMGMEYINLRDDVDNIPVSENVTFGFFDGDRQELIKAVKAVDEDWAQWFDDGVVFCGYYNGKIASFCFADKDANCLYSDGMSQTGSIGCVGTVPEYRRQGIGLKMVALASKKLKEQGCKRCFIHYTAVYNWYARLGYKTFIMLRIGSKEL